MIMPDGKKKFLGNGKSDSSLRQQVTKFLNGRISPDEPLATLDK